MYIDRYIVVDIDIYSALLIYIATIPRVSSNKYKGPHASHHRRARPPNDRRFKREPGTQSESRGGLKADLPLRTVQIGRFSQCPVDARGMPCGSGSVRHCCGTETRTPDGEAQPVGIPSGCRRREACVFSADRPLCRREIGNSMTFTNACVLAILGTRSTVSRCHSPPVQRRGFCVDLMLFMRRFGLCSAWLFNLHF
ncbi:hypothetical protein TcCL_NonESM11346 [Trypanosoma cruzi]|nr:hypothetical protein TcCL_NonESM11346 [Trypanosoma cruzi]